MTAAALDLDAKRAARREAAGEAPTFTFGGVTYTLPVEMPMAVLESVAGLDIDALSDDQAVLALLPMLRALVGDEAWDGFRSAKPSLEDMVDLTEWVWTVYGLDPGEPSQSPQPARATGRPSKRTSKPRTGSTRARSGARAG